MSRQPLAFKRGPTVEGRLDDFSFEITDDRVHLAIGDLEGMRAAWFSWDEWRDFALRVEHAIEWIEKNTPGDAGGASYTVEES